MKSSTRAAPIAVTIAVLVVATISGCAPPTGTTPSPTSSHSSTPQATPTATHTPGGSAPDLGPLPANALFRISATATASNGAVADLVETVFQPSGATAADTALLNMQCNYPGAPDLEGQPTWQEQYPNPLFVTATITSTLRSGSRAWSTDDEIVFGFLGSSAYSGAWKGFQAACSPGLLVVPGTVHGVAPVPSSDPIDGTTGWASGNGEYGFGGGGQDPGQQDVGGTTVISDCTIEVSASAKATSSVAQSWAEHGAQAADGCSFSGPSPA
jgi:hypothetical protein